MSRKVVKRAFKQRFYPTQEQADLLMRTFGSVRLVYNKALEVRTQAWVQRSENVSYAETDRMLTGWKKQPELSFLNEVSSVPLQQALRHLQTAFSNFWAKRASYPTFKSRRKSRASATFTASAFRWNADRRELKLAKMRAPLDIRWSRDLPAGTPSSITVSRDRAGRWFVSLLFDAEIEQLPASPEAVGIDMGLDRFAILSTGEKISNPRFGAKDRKRLARAQRVLARKQKGSKNREKARKRVARIQARTTDTRRDFLHKLSTRIVRENQVIAIEDLNVQGMSAKGGSRKTGLNRSIQDASWSEFRSMLEYKAEWYGRDLVVIDQYFPSSQLCHACGAHEGAKPLSVRRWTCSACGTTHDRDVNAALNILAAGQAVSVCGDGRSLRHAALAA